MTEPRRVAPADLDLLDALPHLAVNLGRVPGELRERLFELTKLSVAVHYETQEAMLTIALPRDELGAVAAAAGTLPEAENQITLASTSVKPLVEASVNAVCAPGQTRTDTGRILSPLPLPIGLQGPDRRRATTLR